MLSKSVQSPEIKAAGESFTAIVAQKKEKEKWKINEKWQVKTKSKSEIEMRSKPVQSPEMKAAGQCSKSER